MSRRLLFRAKKLLQSGSEPGKEEPANLVQTAQERDDNV